MEKIKVISKPVTVSNEMTECQNIFEGFLKGSENIEECEWALVYDPDRISLDDMLEEIIHTILAYKNK